MLLIMVSGSIILPVLLLELLGRSLCQYPSVLQSDLALLTMPHPSSFLKCLLLPNSYFPRTSFPVSFATSSFLSTYMFHDVVSVPLSSLSVPIDRVWLIPSPWNVTCMLMISLKLQREVPMISVVSIDIYRQLTYLRHTLSLPNRSSSRVNSHLICGTLLV